MGRKPSIDESTGAALLAAYQRLGTVAGAARDVGVSESAARRYFGELPKAATPVMASQRQILETAGASLFDTRAALEENYQDLKQLIDQLRQGITLVNGEYQILTPPSVLVSAFEAALKYVTAALKLYQILVSVDETRKFREAVLEAIREADEPTQQRIIAKLQERRTLELAL